MSSDAEDGSASPDPAERYSSIMAEEKLNDERTSSEEKSPDKTDNGIAQPSKPNAKDPSRPRRKKARRACHACQRAHLTCGDERPCLRCVKRGLQDQCQDGVRKKAKYLHDAPAEALVPGFTGNYDVNGANGLAAVSNAAGNPSHGVSGSRPGQYFPHTTSVTYPGFASLNQQSQVSAPLVEDPLVSDFPPPHGVETPAFHSTPSQQVSPVQELPNTIDGNANFGATAGGSFDTSFIDPNDPSLYNFNLADFNFGNQYGALEFGMLGHLSSGALATPDLDVMASHANMSYDQSAFGFNQGLPSWQSVPTTGSRQSSSTNVWSAQGNGTEAYAVGEQAALASQSPRSQDLNAFSSSPETQYAQPDQSSQQELFRQSLSQPQQQNRKKSAFPVEPYSESPRRRRPNTSEIYSSVKSPYSYTQGFHALIAFLQRRFPSKKVLRIAEALATIRPSFISCNQHLNNDDLIFMEKSFQRTLCEYEGFMDHYGTPTVICRRTGEIAAVNKEFSLVTGWRRDVLLGKEPNLNVNTGGNSPGTQTGTSSRGAATPRVANIELDPGRPQPVFLAELLDEDSVVQFYEDFAELAFGASQTSIIGRPCSLVKYRTKNDPGWGPNDHLNDDGKRLTTHSRASLIKGEAGMNALGERDGRVYCSMCWTVQRDMWGIPMLLTINFLPVI